MSDERSHDEDDAFSGDNDVDLDDKETDDFVGQQL
jgi:hypothetical protein